jgi:hypothetical protein
MATDCSAVFEGDKDYARRTEKAVVKAVLQIDEPDQDHSQIVDTKDKV